jgi:hypothetical protein
VKGLAQHDPRKALPGSLGYCCGVVATALGSLELVDPRSIWKHEAGDFTPWLPSNADRLVNVLGIEIELSAAEHPVGGDKLDLVGRDITNDAVLIVENQLEGTDHSPLGQVLTYAAGMAASTIVWIATAFRPEHRQALDWLNENTGERVHFLGSRSRSSRLATLPTRHCLMSSSNQTTGKSRYVRPHNQAQLANEAPCI